MTTFSRRSFVVAMAGAGGGLLLGCRLDVSRRAASATGGSAPGATPPVFVPNAFVRVGTDNAVTVILPQAEMGQGVYTALPMLVAEELEVGLDQVRVEHAPGDDRVYANPLINPLIGFISVEIGRAVVVELHLLRHTCYGQTHEGGQIDKYDR